MSIPKQHVELNRKLWLRRALYSSAASSGAVYIPFIGDGDLAAALYTDRALYGADISQVRIATAQARLPQAVIRLADCNSWPFSDVDRAFSVADFDAYGNPYLAFKAFWTEAHKCFPLVCIFTDGLRLTVQRGNVLWDFAAQRAIPNDRLSRAREQYNFWLRRHALPWVESIIAPYRVVGTKSALRRSMVYWGCVISEKQ